MDQMNDVLAELRELRRRVAELEAQRVERPQVELDERSTRRGVLRLAGAAVVGGAAASLAAAHPAAATTGNMQYGAANNAGTDSTELISSSLPPTFNVANTNATEVEGEYPDAVHGSATGQGTGVHGTIDELGFYGSWAVWGENVGTQGVALVGEGGRSQLQLIPFDNTDAPIGDRQPGEFRANNAGVFYCVTPGDPGVWRKIAGPSTAGAFHPLTPTRVYDSRAVAPSPGLINAGANRTISVADGRDGNGTVTIPNLVPAGATAVAANITVTGTTGGGGYLSVNPGGNTAASSSTINWFGAGQNIANGVTLTLNGSRQLTVVCGLGGGSTHFIIDIAGYYL